MERLFRTFCEYLNDRDFLKFQNDLAKEIYDSLANSYSSVRNEPDMVKNLVDIINGSSNNSFKKLRLFAKFIHGNANSGVTFLNKTNEVTKELADMVIISIATRGQDVIFEKISFVQNKKADKKNLKWSIDQDQLYLLQNFPTFTDNTGKLSDRKGVEMIFHNYSETLGTYGLFHSQGEMILINALNVFKLQDKNTILFDAINKFPYNFNKYNNINFPFCDSMFWEELWHRCHKHYGCYFPFTNFPFLNNTHIAYNIYDFVRNWSLFNIGEVITSGYSNYGSNNGNNDDLYTYCKKIINLYDNNNAISINDNFSGAKAVFVSHLDLGKE
jgi:hypothetical protein